jgi:Periplasmic copper-binding protein (NosD)
MASFVVTQASDNGNNLAPTPGSLRQAILEANADDSSGPSLITFQIGGGGSATIKPPAALPFITHPTIIDATTQPGFAGSPIVVLDGSSSGAGANGIVIVAGNSQVRGLVIDRFSGSGIALFEAGGDVIQGNNIGTDSSGIAPNEPGTIPLGNSQNGILINNAGMNTIGGPAPGQRNIVANNVGDGILASGGVGQSIVGNAIGTDPTGRALLSNAGSGIEFVGVSGSTVGGLTPGSANLIAGNAADGLVLGNGGGNVVEGNLIGASAALTGSNINLGDGILIEGSTNNTIGGLTASARNVVSANRLNGIEVAFRSTGNLIVGNYVGPDATGTDTPAGLTGARLGGNGQSGILIDLSSGNTVGGTSAGAGNLISGNFGSGVTITNDVATAGLPTTANVVQGNIIGLDASGTKGLGNASSGVSVISAPGNTIGGSQSGAGNVISANLGSGVVISGAVSKSNTIQGNRIGTDATGSSALGNLLGGVTIQNAPANVVGGAAPGQRNVISGNFGDGIQVIGQGAAGASIVGNLIGLDAGGTAPVGNLQDGVNVNGAAGVTIGGMAPGEANIVSGNGGNGINVIGANSQGCQILSDLVGTDLSGAVAVKNAFDGIAIVGAIGTSVAGSVTAPSLISGNGRNGVEVTGGASKTVIRSSLIGTNGIGTALGNSLDGVVIADSPNNSVGDAGPGDGNTIAFNQQDGVEVDGAAAAGIAIQGDLILNNAGDGVRMKDASGNVIGNAPDNADPAIALRARDVISGNVGAGIEIMGLSRDTTVQGNLIGTDLSGTAALGNEIGVFLNDAVGNTIGGTTPLARNVISGNRSQGIQIFRISTSTSPSVGGDTIQGNWIGLDATGLGALGNGTPGQTTGVGVFLNDAPNNTIGGTTPAASNAISGNGQTGVTIFGQSSTGNLIEGNVIGASPTGGLLSSTAPAQSRGVLIQDAAGNTIGGVNATSSNLIRGNNIGVEVAGVLSSNAIVENDIDNNAFGVFLNGAAGSLIAFNSIANNTAIGVSILGSLSTSNVVQGNGIDGNTFAGVYVEGAAGNTIGTGAAGSSTKSGVGVPNSISRNGSVGVYLFGGASGNEFRRNLIKANGLYGAFLFNSAGNVSGFVRSGPDANRIEGSGIASFREYTGNVTAPFTSLPPTQHSAKKLASSRTPGRGKK